MPRQPSAEGGADHAGGWRLTGTGMTPEERAALRKKHQHLEVGTDDCGYVAEFVMCDVIRVLDAWESEQNQRTIE